MMLFRRAHVVPLLLWAYVFLSTTKAQQQKARKKAPMKPLGDVLLMVLDSNKDNKVTMKEVNDQLTMLEQLFQMDKEGEVSEYLILLKRFQAVAPKLFELLDSNGDKKLTKSELSFTTKFEKSLGKGGQMKPFIRECFQMLDKNDDDQLSLEEWHAAKEVLPDMAAGFHKIFPLRKTSKELEDFVEDLLVARSDNTEKASEAFNVLDTNGDGFIQRQEVGAAYNTAGREFLNIAEKIKIMGPMMALFGGADMNNNMKTEF